MVNVTYTTFSPDAKMRASVLVEPGLIEMQDRPVPSPKSSEVLVQQTADALDSDRIPGSVKAVVQVS